MAVGVLQLVRLQHYSVLLNLIMCVDGIDIPGTFYTTLVPQGAGRAKALVAALVPINTASKTRLTKHGGFTYVERP